MKKIILATNNAHKVSEISHALDYECWEFFTLRQAGIESDPAEDADTFIGNARIKAKAVASKCKGYAILADDSGLIVDALDGAPGVYSSRYAGEDASDDDNNKKLLRELKDISSDQRSARFVCSLFFIDDDEEEIIAEGTIEGKIGYEEKGTDGFGYDPLFYPLVFEGTKTLAEVTQDEKNGISHRGNALRNLKEKLDRKHKEMALSRE